MKKRLILSLTAIALTGVLFSGCGKSSESASSYDSATSDMYSNSYVETGSTENDSSYLDNGTDYLPSETIDANDSDYLYDNESKNSVNYNYPSEESTSGSSDEGVSSDASASTSDTTVTGEKMVYSGDVSLETLEYDKTMSSLKDKIKEYNGIIQSQSESNSNYYWYDESRDEDSRTAYLTVRIPSDKFEEFINSLSEMGQITNKSTSTENITRTYNDNQAHIEALQKEQARLLEMMDKATTIDEMISVEKRLTSVETELNQANTSKAEMDNDVEYSTISISVSEVNKYTEVEKQEKNFGEKEKAIKNSWNALLVFFQGLLIVLLYILPFAIIALVIIFIIIFYKKKHPKAKKNKNATNLKGGFNPYGMEPIQPNQKMMENNNTEKQNNSSDENKSQ